MPQSSDRSKSWKWSCGTNQRSSTFFPSSKESYEKLYIVEISRLIVLKGLESRSHRRFIHDRPVRLTRNWIRRCPFPLAGYVRVSMKEMDKKTNSFFFKLALGGTLAKNGGKRPTPASNSFLSKRILKITGERKWAKRTIARPPFLSFVMCLRVKGEGIVAFLWERRERSNRLVNEKLYRGSSWMDVHFLMGKLGILYWCRS